MVSDALFLIHRVNIGWSFLFIKMFLKIPCYCVFVVPLKVFQFHFFQLSSVKDFSFSFVFIFGNFVSAKMLLSFNSVFIQLFILFI